MPTTSLVPNCIGRHIIIFGVIKNINLRISGLVQGVFFRQSAKQVAKQLGVTGFIRNEPDGTVYAEAEGEEELIDQFVTWCHKGPPAAKVENMEVAGGSVKGFEDFTIQR